jgi:hypothetical protein
MGSECLSVLSRYSRDLYVDIISCRDTSCVFVDEFVECASVKIFLIHCTLEPRFVDTFMVVYKLSRDELLPAERTPIWRDVDCAILLLFLRRVFC